MIISCIVECFSVPAFGEYSNPTMLMRMWRREQIPVFQADTLAESALPEIVVQEDDSPSES